MAILMTACGCSGALVALREDRQFRELVENSPPPLPYSICIGSAESAFNPEELNKGEEEHFHFMPGREGLRSALAEVLSQAHIFEETKQLDAASAENFGESMKTAWDENFDILVRTKIKKCRVSFEGNTGWYIPNLGLWFYLMVPSWWIRDETYKLEMDVSVEYYSVHTEELIHKADISVSEKRNLDDFQRGWSLFGIFTVPGSLGQSDWRKISSCLLPGVTRDLQISLAKNMLEHFSGAAQDSQFKKAMSKTLAVVVGLSRYGGANIPKLRYAEEDGLGFYNYLMDKNGGGLLPKHAVFLRNEAAAKQAITGAITDFAGKKAKKNDKIVIYFAGYGCMANDASEKDSDDEAFIAGYDTDMENVQETAISLDDLKQLIEGMDCKSAALILDASFQSELFLRALSKPGDEKSFDPLSEIAGDGRISIISSCSRGEGSLELDHFRHGIFTYYLLEGLGGKADADRDGTVTVKEAFDYLDEKVTVESTVESFPQHPRLYGRTSNQPLSK